MTGPIPAQRDGATGADPMLTFVANTVSEMAGAMERGFREVRDDFAEMRRETVTRREFDQQHGELKDRVARIESEREAERLAREAADRQDRRDRRTDRWQRIALATSSSLALIGTAVGVVLHFH